MRHDELWRISGQGPNGAGVGKGVKELMVLYLLVKGYRVEMLEWLPGRVLITQLHTFARLRLFILFDKILI